MPAMVRNRKWFETKQLGIETLNKLYQFGMGKTGSRGCSHCPDPCRQRGGIVSKINIGPRETVGARRNPTLSQGFAKSMIACFGREMARRRAEQ